jgi:hypothetical protein
MASTKISNSNGNSNGSSSSHIKNNVAGSRLAQIIFAILFLGALVLYRNRDLSPIGHQLDFGSTTVRKRASSSSFSCPVPTFPALLQEAPTTTTTTTTTTTYSTPGICSRLPADLSPSHLWQVYQEVILHGSSSSSRGVDDAEEAAWIQDLYSILKPSMLRKTIRTRPQLQAWGRVLQKLHQRLDNNNTSTTTTTTVSPLQVLILTDKKSMEASCKLPKTILEKLVSSSSSSTTLLTSDHGCEWPVKLQQLLDFMLGKGVVQVTTLAIPHATSRLATLIAKYKLWPLLTTTTSTTTSPQQQQPDVVINAYSSSDMYLPQRGVDVSQTTDYYHEQRTVRQAFIRAVLEPNHCGGGDGGGGDGGDAPLVVLLDDYLGPHHDLLLGELTGLRTLQRLADWYQVPLVSYANMVRPLVLADTTTTSSIWGPDWSSGSPGSGSSTHDKPNNHNTKTQLLAPGHLGVLWALCFSFLDYTVDYCSHHQHHHQAIPIETTTPKNDQPVSVPFVKPEVVELVTNVIPPPLDVDLTLNNVSEKWRQEQIHQQQACRDKIQKQQNHGNATTTTTTCPMYFYPGAGVSKNAAFVSMVQRQESHGWSFVDDGRLLLKSDTKKDSKVTVQVQTSAITLDQQQQPHMLHLFVTTHPDNVVKEVSRLHVTVSSVLVVDDKKKKKKKRVVLLGSMDNISNVHGSDSIVALPYQLFLPSQQSNVLQVELRLEGTSSMEIVAMFLCHHDDPGYSHEG